LLAAVALAAFLSMLFPPGVAGLLPPALFLGCWLGHVRRQPAPA
jgi:hypothetical protein